VATGLCIKEAKLILKIFIVAAAMICLLLSSFVAVFSKQENYKKAIQEVFAQAILQSLSAERLAGQRRVFDHARDAEIRSRFCRRKAGFKRQLIDA
jgi:hypothetical protein